jgi:hypothetical protein
MVRSLLYYGIDAANKQCSARDFEVHGRSAGIGGHWTLMQIYAGLSCPKSAQVFRQGRRR